MEVEDFFQVVSQQEEKSILTVENFGKYLSTNQEMKQVNVLKVLH